MAASTDPLTHQGLQGGMVKTGGKGPGVVQGAPG